MKFKIQLATGLEGIIPAEKFPFLPSGFLRIGNIIIVRIPLELKEYEKDIGTFLLKTFDAQSVFSRGIIQGDLRIPQMKRIAGEGNETLHKENGCIFSLDVSCLMFSKGNILERGRLRADDEDVVDMFAGIGYFSLPLAKRSPSCRIVAIEKNPAAARYLRKNIRLNKLTNVEVIEGDCRGIALKNCADRVLMGYFPGTEAFLPAAFGFLRRRGIVHYHNIYRTEELWRKPLGTLESSALENGYRLEKVLYKNRVKQYSPGKYHVVVDAKFQKT